MPILRLKIFTVRYATISVEINHKRNLYSPHESFCEINLKWQEFSSKSLKIPTRYKILSCANSTYILFIVCYDETKGNIFRISYFISPWEICQKKNICNNAMTTTPRQDIINLSSVFPLRYNTIYKKKTYLAIT